MNADERRSVLTAFRTPLARAGGALNGAGRDLRHPPAAWVPGVHLRPLPPLPYPRSSACIRGSSSHDLVQPEVMRPELAAVVAGGDAEDAGDARSIDAGTHGAGDRVEVH